MSRVLLLASLLVAPALAVGQLVPAGQVTFDNGRDFPMFVNGAECGSHARVTVRWNPNPINGYTTATYPSTSATSYKMYASTLDPSTRTGADANACYTTTLTNPVVTANAVGDANNTDPITGQNATLDLTTFIQAAGKSCDDGANDTVIYICVQGLDTSNSNKAFGFASASVTISTKQPPPPVIRSATPGDQALNVSWDPGAAGTFTGTSYSYQLTAEMVATTTTVTDPNTHVSSMFTATSARFGGLVNTVTYAVTAQAFTKAGNASPSSAPVEGTPQFTYDFWDTYKNEFQGRDSGGCASGLAGPLALALLAGAFALARRRR